MVYRWRLRTGVMDSRLVVQSAALSSGAQLVVTLRGWRDVWLNFGEPITGQFRPNAPPVITPRFIEALVRRALLLGWQPDARGGRFLAVYAGGELELQKRQGRVP